MTVEKLRRVMSLEEFRQWQVIYANEPWGDLRDDLRSGQICATNLATVGVSSRPSDFMPEFDWKQAKPQTEDDIKAVFMAIAAGAQKHG